MSDFQTAILISAIFFGTPIILAILLFVSHRRAKSFKKELAQYKEESDEIKGEMLRLEATYSDPIAREKELTRLMNQIDKAKFKRASVEGDIQNLKQKYLEKKEIYDRLRSEAASFDETIHLAEVGFYQPHFRFGDSEGYKRALRKCKSEQKQIISKKEAVHFPSEWTINQSKKEGRKFMNTTVRLTLRAFNNECDAAINAVTWRNAKAMEKRIQKACEQINKENEPLEAYITNKYLNLKLEELWLTIEREEKKKKEAEELAEKRRANREEKKLREEQVRAEREEQETEKRLTEARRAIERAPGWEFDELKAKIARLEQELEQAHARTERAISMAEQTKMGHVYVISNEGSFGKDVFKIGMTRRLDPYDRVKELGDASVPFLFDTHALIFSEDAPALEGALHEKFSDRRVNAANSRKEFFRVTLDEVEEAVRKTAPNADFYREAEAQEYHQTLMLRQQQSETEKEQSFPDEI